MLRNAKVYDSPQLVFGERELERVNRLALANELSDGDRVIVNVPTMTMRWGRVDHVMSSGFVLVQLWSDSLGRFVYGGASYHPKFVRKWDH